MVGSQLSPPCRLFCNAIRRWIPSGVSYTILLCLASTAFRTFANYCSENRRSATHDRAITCSDADDTIEPLFPLSSAKTLCVLMTCWWLAYVATPARVGRRGNGSTAPPLCHGEQIRIERELRGKLRHVLSTRRARRRPWNSKLRAC